MGMELLDVIVRLDVWEVPAGRLIVLGLATAVRPEGVVVDSETNPEKLLKLVNVRMETALDPGVIARLEGLAVKEKSDTEGPMTDTETFSEVMSFPS
jgi:hypothetical protein